MSDKSPRQQLSKKPSKSLKEQRADKRAKQTAAAASIPPPRKQRGKG